MADLHNQQPVIGVRLLSEGATLYNNRPVIGVRAATGLVFTDNQIVRGVEVIDDDRPLYNGQPVVGAVMIDDDRDLYNLQLVVPVEGLTPPFDPSILFANGEQGAWYDPSDLSTLFQDAIGTVPVTADGQPVGLMLDKHAWGGETLEQVVAGQPERLTNGDFSEGSTGWIVNNTDATHIVTFDAGTMRYQSDTTVPVLEFRQLNVLTTGKLYEITTVCSAYESGTLKSSSLGEAVIVTGPGARTIRAVATSPHFAALRGTANVDITLDSISIREIPGNHATQPATASRPTFRTDGALHWLELDGVDDAMATPQFAWGTDKATIVHGSYRADESTRIIFEFSPSISGNPGTFYVVSKSGAVANWASSSRGSAGNSSDQQAYVNIAGPDTAVITATHDIAASLTRVRRNGVYGVDGVGNKGTGNFRSAQLFMFARGGGSLSFNGRFYGAILINRILSADEVVAAETWMAAKAGVTL